MSDHPSPRLFAPLIDGLPATVPFIGAEGHERRRGRPFRARIGANENGFGPSEATQTALRDAVCGAWMYGDAESLDLRAALAARLGGGPENIVVGEGIDALLGYACRLALSPGDVAVAALGAYPTFAYHVAGYGGRLATVPYRQDREDAPALVAKARETGARLLYIANPDNPMGSWTEGRALAEALAAAPEDCLILLDEAYLETAPEETAPPLDLDRPNLLRLRTFSKAYGLAGMRIGYALGAPATIAGFEKIRNHFGVGRLAQIGALAALRDAAGLARILDRIAGSRERIGAIARAGGLAPLPSATNFVAIDCGGETRAKAILAGLMARDVFVRTPGVAPLSRCVRVSCGPEAEMAVLEEALPEAVAEADAARP